MTRYCLVILSVILCAAKAIAAGPATRGFPTAPSGGTASFAPPINPAISGAPGADKYLQSNASGVVSWAAKPPATGISSGTGYVKQTAPGVFSNIALIPVGDYAPRSSAALPALLGGAVAAGDLLKVSGGKWIKCSPGDQAWMRALQSGSSGDLVNAEPCDRTA